MIFNLKGYNLKISKVSILKYSASNGMKQMNIMQLGIGWIPVFIRNLNWIYIIVMFKTLIYTNH